MKLRRIWGLLLACLLVGVLPGCNENDDVDDDDSVGDDDDSVGDDDDSIGDDDDSVGDDDDSVGDDDSGDDDSADNSGQIDCWGGNAVPPSDPIEIPSLSEWQNANSGLPAGGDPWSQSPFQLELDPSVCTAGFYSGSLPLGSAFAAVRPVTDGQCEVWLGGETESPGYDGLPTQYCLLPPNCDVVFAEAWGSGGIPMGGPAFIDSPYCAYGSPQPLPGDDDDDSGDDDDSAGDDDDSAVSSSFHSFHLSFGAGPCQPGNDCSSYIDLNSSRGLTVDKFGDPTLTLFQATISMAEFNTVVPILTDPALVALLDMSTMPCLPPTDIFESMELQDDDGVHQNSTTMCPDAPLGAVRTALTGLQNSYFP